ILNPQKERDAARIEELRKSVGVRISDTYTGQLTEYFAVSNPGDAVKSDFESHASAFIASRGDASRSGRWVFYPWVNELVHILDQQEFEAVRFSRNNNLITPFDQKKLLAARVGIVGLSIGSNVAIALSLIGAGSY